MRFDRPVLSEVEGLNANGLVRYFLSAKALLLFGWLVALGMLAGCSPLSVINGLAPSDTYRLTRDIAYGSHARQQLDVYVPATGADKAAVVVFFYGGNWSSGARADYLFVGEALASRGFVTVVADYRLYPEVRYPDFLDDCAQAVRWTASHIGDFGGDQRRIFLMGHSAGAYNAAMIALNARYLRAAGVEPAAISGWIGLAGPYDFLPIQDKTTRKVFGYPDTPPATQPIRYVSAASLPALLVTGDADDIVDPRNSMRLAAQLRTAGVSVKEVVYPGLGHRLLVGALAKPLRNSAPVLDDVVTFMQATGSAAEVAAMVETR